MSDTPSYDPQAVEAAAQRRWDERHVNEPDLDRPRRPFYNLMMFPYPSAEGLHVGNMFAFTGADIYGRFQRLQGHDVFEPIGFDAFGIHSERSEEHTSELQSPCNLVCRLLLEKKKKKIYYTSKLVY